MSEQRSNELPVFTDSRLIFTFAHDIRSQLRTILTRIQLTQAGAGERLSERENSFLTDAVSAAGEIESLLTAMVAYCSVGAEGPSIGLQMMMRGLLLETKEILQQAGASLELVAEVDVTVTSSLKTVLKELILNSCRFRRQDIEPRIHLTITPTLPSDTAEGSLEIVIWDNGIGVGDPYLEKIFEPFQRLQPKSQYPGHGLGLAICRRIVTMQRGRISATAGPLGGLMVRATVPLPQTA